MERTHRRLLVAVAMLVALTGVGMYALWPAATPAPEGVDVPLYEGVVRSAESYECPTVDPVLQIERTTPCQRVEVEIATGPEAGTTFDIDTGEEDYPFFEVGDELQIGVSSPEGAAERTYYVNDFIRGTPLVVLVVLFVAATLLVGRWHGFRSIVGLGLSLGVVITFVVPAIASGRNPFAVAVVGAFAIMLVTLYLAHGLNLKTTAALIGTAAALGLTTVLGLVFVEAADLTGFTSEEANLARYAVAGLDLRGLVLAALVIGALGVLDDVTVSQASTVFALHDANPGQRWGELVGRAMSVGRDHIASTVNTLVLAYVGASLPLILLYSTGDLPVGEVLNAEVVAEEIVTTLVGSLGLISAVPLTTALAATVALRRPVVERPVPGHLRDDVSEEDLSDEEIAHRRWIDFLREGPGDDLRDRPEADPPTDDDGGAR